MEWSFYVSNIFSLPPVKKLSLVGGFFPICDKKNHRLPLLQKSWHGWYSKRGMKPVLIMRWQNWMHFCRPNHQIILAAHPDFYWIWRCVTQIMRPQRGERAQKYASIPHLKTSLIPYLKCWLDICICLGHPILLVTLCLAFAAIEIRVRHSSLLDLEKSKNWVQKVSALSHLGHEI